MYLPRSILYSRVPYTEHTLPKAFLDAEWMMGELWMNRCVDGWMDGWMDEWMDGWKNKATEDAALPF